MILQPVPEIYDVWEWVKSGLQRVKDKTGERWLVEDVYAALKAGNAFLYTIADVGFVIVQKHLDSDGAVLFIWAIWIEPGEGRKIEQQLYDELDTLAKGIKAKRIRYYSPRDAWRQRGAFTAVSTIYEREVTL